MRVFILGATGMLGHSLLWSLHGKPSLQLFAGVRGSVDSVKALFPSVLHGMLVQGVNVYDIPGLEKILNAVQPDIVINAIGIIRQLPEGQDPLTCIEINARFPHVLRTLCSTRQCRLIHYSTDCVFSGRDNGPYTEETPMTAGDVYGITKYLGEVKEAPALTIRTSIIGPELRNRVSLVEWFLSQQGQVRGYTHALYTGLPTNEHGRILAEYVLPNPDLTGLYQVSSTPISKYDLLHLVAGQYKKDISILPDDRVREDKRLDSTAFSERTGYVAPPWPELVAAMHADHMAWKNAMGS